MAELALHPKSAFADLLKASLLQASGPSPAGVTVREITGLSIATLIAGKGVSAGEIGGALGLDLRDAPERTAAMPFSFTGIGRGKWLVTGVSKGAFPFASLQSALGTMASPIASLFDQSSSYGVLELAGPGLFRLLEKGVQVDLAPEAFPVNAALTTAIAHLGVTLVRTGQDRVEVLVWRSMAGDFLHWLEASAAQFGLAAG